MLSAYAGNNPFRYQDRNGLVAQEQMWVASFSLWSLTGGILNLSESESYLSASHTAEVWEHQRGTITPEVRSRIGYQIYLKTVIIEHAEEINHPSLARSVTRERLKYE